MQIEGSRVRVRDWTEEDLVDYEAWIMPPSGGGEHEWQRTDGPFYPNFTAEGAQRWLGTLREHVTAGDWPDPRETMVIADAADDRFIGQVSWYWTEKPTADPGGERDGAAQRRGPLPHAADAVALLEPVRAGSVVAHLDDQLTRVAEECHPNACPGCVLEGIGDPLAGHEVPRGLDARGPAHVPRRIGVDDADRLLGHDDEIGAEPLRERTGAVHGVLGELHDVDRLGLEHCRPGVEAGDLQEVLHHGREALDVGHEQVEGGLRPLRQVVPPALQHLDRGRQGGERRAELVADIGGEPGVTLDSLLAPVGQVAGFDTPYPYVQDKVYLPGPNRITAACVKALNY